MPRYKIRCFFYRLLRVQLMEKSTQNQAAIENSENWKIVNIPFVSDFLSKIKIFLFQKAKHNKDDYHQDIQKSG